MFNNCNPKTNGELYFLNLIHKNINVIFDVGCRTDSEFIELEKEVHYFDPVPNFIKTISEKKNKNTNAYFNNFGLSDKVEEIFYYPKYQSFYDRTASCINSDNSNKIILKVKTAKHYIENNKINSIDFLKIDTEGYELNVLKGFGELLNNVKIIQFEYGGTFLDNNTKLNDVIEYLKKYNFHKFSYLSQNRCVPIEEVKRINVNPQARRHGYPSVVEITGDYIPDHYNYSNIVCINKAANLDSLF